MIALKEIRPVIDREIRESSEAAKAMKEAVQNEDDLHGLHFIGVDIALETARSLEFYNCIFENCRFIKNDTEKLAFVDVRFDQCDLSNLNMNGAVFQRVEMVHCRAVGLSLTNTLANHLSIHDCNCRYLNINASDWHLATIENTDCTNASIQECKLKSVQFIRCNLNCSDFCHTRLNGMDFTTDELEGVTVASDELRGAIVTPVQACELAKMLGVVIRSEADQ